MIAIKIILVLAICFIALFLLKKLVFYKIFIPLCIFFMVLFKIIITDNPETLPNEKAGRVIVILGWIYLIFDFLERFLLFAVSTAILYNAITFTSHFLIGSQLLATYISATLTLIVICYMSRYYGFIYSILNGRKKTIEESADVLENEDDVYTKSWLNTLREAFDKRIKFKNTFSSDRLRLIAYMFSFIFIFVSRVEIFMGCPLFYNQVWMDLSRVALESSITFIAFDRIYGHIQKMRG